MLIIIIKGSVLLGIIVFKKGAFETNVVSFVMFII